MRVSEIDFVKFLPDLMQDDPDVIAIAKAQNLFYKIVGKKIDILSRWGKFDQMTEEELNLFAEDFYIPWYKTSDTKSVKVSTLEHFIDVWSTLGTPKAIETVLEDIYGSADLIEWFSNKEDYRNGEFAVQVANFASFTQENKDRFLRILEIVKRKSQKIASVFTITTTAVDFFAGVRAVGLQNGYSGIKATLCQPDIDVSLTSFVGLNIQIAKTDICRMVAE